MQQRKRIAPIPSDAVSIQNCSILKSFSSAIKSPFPLNRGCDELVGFPPHLPEALELPLLDTKQLTGLPADNGSVPRRVVQDGLPERRPNSQSANGDCILQASALV